MNPEEFDLTEAQAQERDGLIERLLRATAGVFDIFTIIIGYRFGLYKALTVHGPLTSSELAAHTGTYERYPREWLVQQTVAGIVAVVYAD